MQSRIIPNGEYLSVQFKRHAGRVVEVLFHKGAILNSHRGIDFVVNESVSEPRGHIESYVGYFASNNAGLGRLTGEGCLLIHPFRKIVEGEQDYRGGLVVPTSVVRGYDFV